MGRRGLSQLSPAGILGTVGTHSFHAPWSLKLQVPLGLSGRGLFSPPGALGTAVLNRFSLQASPRRVRLSHFRPPGYFIPQARLGLAGSVFSVAQVPRGLASLNNSRLLGTFGTVGTQSFQAPGSFQHPGTVWTGGISIFIGPSTLGTIETQ